MRFMCLFFVEVVHNMVTNESNGRVGSWQIQARSGRSNEDDGQTETFVKLRQFGYASLAAQA
jgi:hypothetical protein